MKNFIFSLFVLSLFFISLQAAISDCVISTTPTGGVESCVRCKVGFVVSQAGQCVAEISNCYEYENDGARLLCKTCIQGFVKTFNAKLCVTPIPNCLVHLDGDTVDKQTCAQCAPGFNSSNAGKTCVRSIPGCNRYNSQGNCTEIRGCKTYNADPRLCDECLDDRKPSASKLLCLPGIKDCAILEEDGTCRSCTTGKLSNTRRSCLAIDSNCAEANDLGLCTRCVDPSTVPAIRRPQDCLTAPCGNKCVAPKANCSLHADSGECIRCNNPALTLLNGVCYNTIPFCIQYSASNKCSQCLPKFVPDQIAEGDACVPTETGCVSYDPRTGVCQKCSQETVLTTRVDFIGTVSRVSAAVCATLDKNCVAYGFAEKKCIRCRPFYELKDGVCNKFVDGCDTYDSVNSVCKTCKADFSPFKADGTAAASGDVIASCKPNVEGCKTLTSTGCTECTSADDELTGNGKCVRKITDCKQYDDVRKACVDCGEKALSKSGKKCGTTIANCDFLDDADITKCSVCAVNYVLSLDRKSCQAEESSLLTLISGPTNIMNGVGQIIVNSAGRTYCLTHQINTIIGSKDSNGAPINKIALPLTADQKLVTIRNCDEVDYKNTLWQIRKEDGTEGTLANLEVKATGMDFSVAVYYPTGVENAPPTSLSSVDHTKIQLWLDLTDGATLAANTLAISEAKFATFTASPIRKTTTGGDILSTTRDLFESQLSIRNKGSRTVTIASKDTYTISATATASAVPGFLGFNSLTPVSPLRAYSFSSTAPTVTWFDIRKVYLDASPARDKPLALETQVSQKYTVNDDLITFEWTIAGALTDLTEIFPAVLGENGFNQTDRTALYPNVCNSRYGFYAPNSGWFSSLEKPASGPSVLKKIILTIPIFDLVTRCNFTYVTSTTGADRGQTTMRGRMGYFTQSKENNYGDGLFQSLTLTLGVLKAERNLYIDNPPSYQWYKFGNDINIQLRFNSLVRFFNGNQEIFGYQDVTDFRGLVIPAALASNSSALQGRLSLVSYDFNDQFPAEMSADTLDRNIKPYKDLNENLTVTSVTVKLIKTLKNDANALKYVSTVSAVAATNLRPSPTERNTVFFNLDLRGIVSGSYTVVLEYQVICPRIPVPRRLLTENQETPKAQEKVEIQENLAMDDEREVITLTGSAAPFKLEYESNFGIKMKSIVGFLLIIFLAWI